MIAEEAKAFLYSISGDLGFTDIENYTCKDGEKMREAIKALEQEPSRDMKEIREVIGCDADAETKCKMISNILTAKPHYFEKQDPCDDCISRKELLKIYEDRFLELQKIKHLKDNKGAEDRQMGINYCINILKEMPSVTSAEKVGRLVDTDDGHSVECSKCGKWFFHGYLAKIEIKYCPNCGAKMQEVEE